MTVTNSLATRDIFFGAFFLAERGMFVLAHIKVMHIVDSSCDRDVVPLSSLSGIEQQIVDLSTHPVNKIASFMEAEKPHVVHCHGEGARTAMPAVSDVPIVSDIKGKIKSNSWQRYDFFIGGDSANLRRLVAKTKKPHRFMLVEGDDAASALATAYRYIAQAGKPYRHYVDSDEADYFPFAEQYFSQISMSPRYVTRKVRLVAAAYLLAHEDISVALDAARLQAERCYNFVKRKVLSRKIEILSEGEINIMMANRRKGII